MAETGRRSNERPATTWLNFEEEGRSLSPLLQSSVPPFFRVCYCPSVNVCACVSCQSSVWAVVLQLGDDGDQVLETKDVVAVLALMDHTVLPVMSAGGVSKVNHSHIHQGAAGV